MFESVSQYCSQPDVYVCKLGEGLATSLELTFVALFIGCILSLIMTVILIVKFPVIDLLAKGLITLFTGTPLLVQIFLIYYGPGQFDWIKNSFAWSWLSQAWFCAIIALSLNTAAYSTLLFKGAFDAIPSGQWEACRALGMNTRKTLGVLLPFAIRRAIPAYSNEVILIFKGTSLASTITIMDLMGYTQRINAQTYDTLTVFGMAGLFYLLVNGSLTVIFRIIEKHVLAFENQGH